MSSQLRIEVVDTERFGGLTKHRLEFPSAPMVVVHGPNEAGKSTLLELIVWLLVGPSSSSDVVRRYGGPGDILSGSLIGNLRGDEFVATASFRVTPAGGTIGKASTREYRLGSLLTPDQWREHIRGVDAQTLAGIYRLWGQQLHDGGDADRELRRAGLGALAGSADPRELARAFEQNAKRGAKIGSEGSSLNSVAVELQGVVAELREADRNVDDHRTLQADIDELVARKNEVERRRSGWRKRRELLKGARKLDRLRRAETEVRRVLESCEVVPEPWEQVVDDLPAVDSSIASCRDARKALEAAQVEFGKQIVAVGAPESTAVDEVIEGIAITRSDIGPVATMVSNVLHARQFIEEASLARANALEANDEAAADLDLALGEMSTDVETLREARLDEDDRMQLIQLSEKFKGLLGDVERAGLDHDRAVAHVAETQRCLDLAVSDWDRFGLGVSPSQWQARRSVATEGLGPTRTLWWLLLIVIAVLGLFSAVTGQWLMLGLAVVAMLISLTARPKAVEVQSSDEVGAAATRVTDAQRLLDEAEVGVQRTVSDMSAYERRVASVKVDLPTLSRQFGITIPSDPLRLRGSLDRWVAMRRQLESLDSLTSEVESTSARLARAEADAALVRERLDRLLVGLGLPPGIAPEAAESSATCHVDLVEAARGVVDCRNRAAEAEAGLSAVMEPVTGELESWSLDRLSEHANRMADLLARRRTAESDHAKALQTVDLVIGDDPDLRSLLDEGPEAEDRELESERLDELIRSADAEVEGISGELALKDNRLDEIRRADRLADLRVREGSLVEARDELALEAASRRLAGVMLRAVADDYESKNQPQLIKRTAELASTVAGGWKAVVVKSSGSDSSTLHVHIADRSSDRVCDVPATSLSTGARALLYLSLRLAMAEQDGHKRGLDLPLLCDDPLIHLDDDRAASAVQLLGEAAQRRQVLMFTCHQRTVEVAESVGAEVVCL